jgi:hypothetical protein
MAYRQEAEIDHAALSKALGVSPQSVSGMVTQAKRNPNVRMQLRRLNYGEEDIPSWFKRPTAAQQKTFDAALIGAAPTPEAEPEEEQAEAERGQAQAEQTLAGAGGAGVNTRKTLPQGQGSQERQLAPAAYAPGMGAPTNTALPPAYSAPAIAAIPPGTGAPAISAEQQQLLSGAGISFFNNS